MGSIERDPEQKEGSVNGCCRVIFPVIHQLESGPIAYVWLVLSQVADGLC